MSLTTKPVPNLVKSTEASMDVILMSYLTPAGVHVCDFLFNPLLQKQALVITIFGE